MEIYCLLCGSKISTYDEIDPCLTPMEYQQDGIVGIFFCPNEDCKAAFHVFDLESEDVDFEDIYRRREIRYFFQDDSNL